MGLQTICDECLEPIDQAKQYATATAQIVSMQDGVLTSHGSLQLDYHIEHLPESQQVKVQEMLASQPTAG